MTQDPNPYESPQTIDAKFRQEVSEDSPWKIYIQWTLVLGFNLIVPLYLAQMIVDSMGKVGVYGGVMVIYGIGLGLCVKMPWIAKTLNAGGFAVGISQLFPVLQLVAGFIAIGAVGYGRIVLGSTSNSWAKIDTVMSGFTTTLITGGFLTLVSIGVGKIILMALHSRIDRREAEQFASFRTPRDFN